MGAVAKLPVYLTVADHGPVEVGTLEINLSADGSHTVSDLDIAAALRAAADAYDAEPEQDAEGVPDAAAQQ